MSEDAPVYADTDTGQLALPGADKLGASFFSEFERQGHYTAERLKECWPDKLNMLVTLLADPSMSLRAITRATGCHHYTLKAVMAEYPDLIEAERKRLSLDWKVLSSMATDRIIEKLDEVEIKNTTDLRNLSIIGAVSTEKAELLAGNATSRVARREERLEDVEDHFSNLPDPDTAIEADFAEITGFDGQADAPKEPGGSEEVDADQESGDLNPRTTDNQ